jgi:hypothetical protein
VSTIVATPRVGVAFVIVCGEVGVVADVATLGIAASAYTAGIAIATTNRTSSANQQRCLMGGPSFMRLTADVLVDRGTALIKVYQREELVVKSRRLPTELHIKRKYESTNKAL